MQYGAGSKGGRIQCRTDNAAVVSIVNSGQSKDELAMHLVRCLAFFAAYFEYRIRAIHILGREMGQRMHCRVTALPNSVPRSS